MITINQPHNIFSSSLHSHYFMVSGATAVRAPRYLLSCWLLIVHYLAATKTTGTSSKTFYHISPARNGLNEAAESLADCRVETEVTSNMRKWLFDVFSCTIFTLLYFLPPCFFCQLLSRQPQASLMLLWHAVRACSKCERVYTAHMVVWCMASA